MVSPRTIARLEARVLERAAYCIEFEISDPRSAFITLTRVDYHGEDGQVLRSLLESPLELAPFQSKTVLIPINDTSGGVGANFIVEWTSGSPALSPIAEAIMTSGSGGPGPSFTTRGRVIERRHAN